MRQLKEKEIHHMSTQTLIRSLSLLLLLLFCILLILNSCSLSTGISLKQATPTATPMLEQPLIAPHRPYITVAAYFDITGSDYPSALFTSAISKVASAIDQAVQLNEDGATFYISWLSHNSFASDNTALVITIPALQADPPAPALLGSPAATGDPYQDEKNRRHVQEINVSSQATWQH